MPMLIADGRSMIQSLADTLFLPYAIVALLGTGLFFTIRLGFVQFRRLPEALRAVVTRSRGAEGRGVLSPFQAFATSLAASVGTGNIAGSRRPSFRADPARSSGSGCSVWSPRPSSSPRRCSGSGSAKCRVGKSASVSMYFLRDGLRSPALAWFYAFVAGIAALSTTPFTQPNSMAIALDTVFGIPPWIAGVVIAVLVAAVILGGIKSIGRAAEKLAPLKVALYLIGGVIVIVSFADRLPYVFSARVQ